MKNRWNRKKGRFVLEAAVLVPGICILLVYLVYFTLYTHDCAVVEHGMLESGVKGIYREENSDQAIQDRIQNDLEQKLNERLLWINDAKVQVKVNPVRVTLKVSGNGNFLPTEVKVETQETLYRIAPCQIIRRSRWLRKSGEE